MTRVLDELRYDDEARVVVITGAGETFCAGMDLQEFFTDLQPIRRNMIAYGGLRWNGARVRYVTIRSRRSP